MKIQKIRRSILHFSSCFITFGVAAYPAIFMATGESAHAGHGIGSALSIRVNQQADAYAFLFDQLGTKLRQANAIHAE
jgi:hypothetical protein